MAAELHTSPFNICNQAADLDAIEEDQLEELFGTVDGMDLLSETYSLLCNPNMAADCTFILHIIWLQILTQWKKISWKSCSAQ